MWVSRKRMDALEKRLRDLEAKSVAVTLNFGPTNFPEFAHKIVRYVDEQTKETRTMMTPGSKK